MSFYLSEKAYNQIIGNTSKSKEESTPYLGIETTPAKPEQQGIIGDVVDSVQMGAWKGLSDLAHGLGAITGADWLHKAGDLAAKGADENMATMSDEMKAALNQSALDGEGKGIANIRWWAGNLGSILGQNLDTVLTLGFGKVATIGVKQAGKMLLKREAAEQVGKIAVEQAAKRGVPPKYLDMVGYTAIQTAMSGGSRYGQKRDEVMAMDNETLAKLPEFSNAYYEIADSDEGKDKTVEELYSLAKTRFADKVGQSAALNPTAIMTDIGVNAISGLGGGFKGLLSPAQTVKGGLVKGALIEGGTEAVQGIAEQYALNQAQKDYIDPNQDLTEGMQENAINGAILGGVFGGMMGGIDSHSHRRELNQQKRTILEHINTGDVEIDEKLRRYTDSINQSATDLADLVKMSQVQRWNNQGQSFREKQQQQAQRAQFESDFFGEEQVEAQAENIEPEFKPDSNLDRALDLHSILTQFRKNDFSRANEFMDTPMVFDNVQAKKDYVIGRAFDEVRNIAQAYGIDPQDGKAMRQWLEDYAEKAKEYGENQQHFNAPTSNLQSEANIAPTSREGVIEGVSDEIDVGNGNYQPFQYEVVDATTLSPTQQKDDNQFRDRDRTASQSQINNIARNLDPRKLAASPTMDIGAPLLALDGKTIIAGNGRSMALRQAYQEGGAEGYRQFLKDNADRFGVDSAQLDAVENPVLVRRLTSPVDIAQVAINSNEQGGMRMSELEQAKVDARRLPSMDSFVADEHSEINSTDNQQFIRQFIQNHPENLRNELLDSKGNLSQTGVQRIRNAMLYQAYGDSQTLSRLIENTDQGAKNVLNALTALAPKVAQTQQDINSGVLSDVSISRDIIQAVEKYNQLNEQGYKISDYLAQNDFVGDLTPEAREILTIFDKNRRSGKRIAQVLGAYFDQAQMQGNLSQASMFGDVEFDKLGSLQQAKNADEAIRLSLNESANSDFAKAVDKIAQGKRGRNDRFLNMGMTPPVLKMLGLKEVKVAMRESVIDKILFEHSVSVDDLKRIPAQINNPIAIMRSNPSSTNPNGLVVLTELNEVVNGKEKPIIAALQLKKSGDQLEVINIASVYGRDLDTQIGNDLSRAIYWNKTKGYQFARTVGLQLPSSLTSVDNLSVSNVKTEAELSQYLSAKNNQETQINPEIQRAQDILRKNLGKAAEHIEVIAFANPPKDVRHLITSDVEGWFNPKTGKVTLIADSINATKTMSKEERLQFVAWHEMAHRGINVGYKGSYDSLMQEVGKNKAISQIADAIQTQRKNTDDLAATNRSVAIEEAIAEMMAAHETGKWNELESRYGVEIKKGQRQSTKSWLAMTAQRIKEFLSKIFGAERAAQFSDEDVLNLVAKIKESAVGELNENGDVRFSRNEELTKEHYNQAKENAETELTFHQWKQVRTPEFKAWFGDWENDPKNASKVINPKTGEPLVVYHGSKSKFTTFDKERQKDGWLGRGFYFTPNKNVAKGFGKSVSHSFINIKHPFEVKGQSPSDVITEVNQKYGGALGDQIQDILSNNGYDGVIFNHWDTGIILSTFEPNQIKSATDNTGAFSKENDDIRFSRQANNNMDQHYMALAKRYKNGDSSVESELRSLVNNRAQEKGFGKPDYRMEHSAPNSKDEISQSVDNLSGLYPDDLYSNKGYQYYGSGYDSMDRKAWEILKRVKGNPDAKVTIYRAYPKDTGGTITNGDWVTIVRDYAVEHGEANLDGDYQIVSKDVKASEVFTNADSLLEQGYDNGLSEVVNDKKKIKLDELITYDDDGEIIPLSKRFNTRKNDVRFSRANTTQSARNLAKTGKAQTEPSLWDNLMRGDLNSFKRAFHQTVSKLDEYLADSLRPVNDWIDNLSLADQTGNTSSRDHEKRRLKDAMYTAKGKRDAMNSELEQAYLKPILSKIAAMSKATKKTGHYIDELTMKRMVGNWISARYAIEKNRELLARDKATMDDAKRQLDDARQQGANSEKINRLNNAYLKAKAQYDDRKADIHNTDYDNEKRFKVGVAGGWSIPEAQDIMNDTERYLSRAQLEEVANLIYDLNQAKLDIDRASGRFTDKEYQQYKANRHYVPLTGDPNADIDSDIISGAGSSAVNIGRDKTLKGRTNSEAEDAIDAVWKSVGKSTTYAGFAEFKSRIDDLYETEVALLKNKGFSLQQAQAQARANLGIDKQKMQGLTRSSDDVLIRKQGGEYFEYRLPTQIMEALRNDNVEHANDFLKVLSKPTGWYARGVTQWSVMFAPMNMLRDTWEKSEFIRVQKLYDKNNRLVDSKTMDKIGRDTIKNALTDKEVWNATKRLGFGQELRDSVPAERMLKQLLKEGGVSNYGTYLDKTETDLIKRLKKENNPLSNKLEKVGNILEGYNKTFDTVSALAAYKALVENGVDSKQAAATTLELTNFRKTGSKMRGIKALYMFSQPTVMGAANLMRYLSTRKGQIRFIGYMAVMTSLYTVLRSMDDEDEGGNKMDQLGYITRYIPIPLGEGKYFKIPVGFGMAQMAWNFSTNIVKGAVGDISLTEAGANMLVHSLKTFSPVSPSEISAAKYPMEKIALTVTPTILQPIMQNVVNRSAFGNKITTNYVRDDKLKAEQSKATTAQFWKDTALFMNDNLGIDMHPEQIKNLFDGYSSMFGSLKELSTIFVENPNREALGRKTKMPFISQFIGTTNEFSIQSRYYEASEEAGSVYKEYKSRKERNELGNWLDADKMKLIKFHEQEESIVKKARSEKANLTRSLRSGKISAIAYENGIKRYNKDVSRVQAKMLHKYRIMEGLNTN